MLCLAAFFIFFFVHCCFSVSTEISGKVTVDGFFSKAGFRFNARTHASASIGGEIKYEEGQEFEVNIDAPEEPVDLFSYKYVLLYLSCLSFEAAATRAVVSRSWPRYRHENVPFWEILYDA